ncbi:transmembrane protein 272-like isoform X2 [Stegostoma tigrinum]|uniref:transmembrane protein 272-like isoform X2 n=1 Tax=Stegostoma tigrinum TaxID=3053191 RepID=UPI00202B7DAD|nr:transmembrane protein 272-like isoform X2 [Stegostoma tigrinum]
MEHEANWHTPLLQVLEQPPAAPAGSVCLKGFTLILGIACIIVGSIYLDSCTKQHLIPIYLIVSGICALLFLMVSLIPRSSDENNIRNKFCQFFTHLESLFSFFWLITGSVWIYSIYQPDYIDKTSPNYCNKTLYLFAFWITTITYIFLGLMMLFGICACILGGTVILTKHFSNT